MMQHLRFDLLGLFFLAQVLSGPLVAQSWDLVKEQDGIQIFTRHEAGKSLKAYKGMAVIRAPAEKVFTLIEDVNHTEWWDPNLSQIKVLAYEKNKRAQYYLVYDSPWPVANRDLCVVVTVNADPIRSIFTVSAVPLAGVIPEREDRVRIKDYRQTWTVSSAGENLTQVVLEGYVDPAGNIPVWISNMLVIESPINAILRVKQRMENK
jgi:hypothetical protein